MVTDFLLKVLNLRVFMEFIFLLFSYYDRFFFSKLKKKNLEACLPEVHVEKLLLLHL